MTGWSARPRGPVQSYWLIYECCSRLLFTTLLFTLRRHL